jgi:hypothetical protein
VLQLVGVGLAVAAAGVEAGALPREDRVEQLGAVECEVGLRAADLAAPRPFLQRAGITPRFPVLLKNRLPVKTGDGRV